MQASKRIWFGRLMVTIILPGFWGGVTLRSQDAWADEGGQTMTGFIASAALGDSVQGSLQYNTLFAVGLTLFVITLFINIISIRLVNRFREIY